jgi:hypothetical protein
VHGTHLRNESAPARLRTARAPGSSDKPYNCVRRRFGLQHYVSALAETVTASGSQGALASGRAGSQTVAPGRPTHWADNCGGGGGGILNTVRCFFDRAPAGAPRCAARCGAPGRTRPRPRPHGVLCQGQSADVFL